MKRFAIVNEGMGQISYAVLLGTLQRVLTLRECELGGENPDYTIRVAVSEALANDRYQIKAAGATAWITAANECAVHAAVGTLLMKMRFDGRGGYIPYEGEVDHTPAKPVRGIYLATHFFNFYQNAPLEKVLEVVEDLALRGCNCIEAWFDMHHYRSTKEPAAREMLVRLRGIFTHVKAIGMKVALSGNSNEAFMDSPKHLRARWDVNGAYIKELQGHYHVEICPSKPGGIEQILAYRREMLECFADLDVDYVNYWPYDQGGCTCPDCQPWGANGFIKLYPRFEKLVKEIFPHAEVIVGTWYFDRFIPGEWDAFYPKMSSETFAGVHFFKSFFHNGNIPECIRKNGLPEGKAFFEFPEISMAHCSPWGGFGASVLTSDIQKTNASCSHLYQGCTAYSEGIYEDANKYMVIANYDGTYTDAFEALRAYVKFEFCCEDEELYEAIRKTETGLGRERYMGTGTPRYPIYDTSDIDFVHETLSRYNETLPEKIRQSSKFRLFYLRAVIDYEMKEHDFVPSASPRCVEAMKEVCAIYYTNEETRSCVRPPIGAFLNENV